MLQIQEAIEGPSRCSEAVEDEAFPSLKEPGKVGSLNTFTYMLPTTCFRGMEACSSTINGLAHNCLHRLGKCFYY